MNPVPNSEPIRKEDQLLGPRLKVTSQNFSLYTQFNDKERRHFAGMKHRIHSLPKELFPTDTLGDRLARSLAKHRVIHIKELLEAFEFFVRVRRRLRRPTIVDICAGHGLAGLIFALCEPLVTRVELIDERKPESFDRILQAFVEIAPWVREKVEYKEQSFDLTPPLSRDSAVLLVHACGPLTDQGLALAASSGLPVAAMPCCYGKAHPARVSSLNRFLGGEMSIDVSRCYSLNAAGYQVDLSHIPEAITPMNRILVAWNHRGANS